MTTPILEQLTEEYAGLKQLPDFVDRLLDMLRDPIVSDWRGRNGLHSRCAVCNATHRWRTDLTHRNSCRWVAAMKQAEELRAGGVLPPKPAVKATAMSPTLLIASTRG
jgi:hypothetical protein